MRRRRKRHWRWWGKWWDYHEIDNKVEKECKIDRFGRDVWMFIGGSMCRFLVSKVVLTIRRPDSKSLEWWHYKWRDWLSIGRMVNGTMCGIPGVECLPCNVVIGWRFYFALMIKILFCEIRYIRELGLTEIFEIVIVLFTEFSELICEVVDVGSKSWTTLIF